MAVFSPLVCSGHMKAFDLLPACNRLPTLIYIVAWWSEVYKIWVCTRPTLERAQISWNIALFLYLKFEIHFMFHFVLDVSIYNFNLTLKTMHHNPCYSLLFCQNHPRFISHYTITSSSPPPPWPWHFDNTTKLPKCSKQYLILSTVLSMLKIVDEKLNGHAVTIQWPFSNISSKKVTKTKGKKNCFRSKSGGNQK